MKAFECQSCGSHEFREENGYRVCLYCGTKHIITAEDKRIAQSTINLQDDVSRLLQQCKDNPERSQKIAARILEMDPNNSEAKRILYGSQAKAQSPSGGCYVATAVYGSYDCPQVWTLRRFRDDTLAGTWYGRAFIRTYYAISPTLVKWFGKTEWFKRMWKGTLDRMIAYLNAKGVKDDPYEDRTW